MGIAVVATGLMGTSAQAQADLDTKVIYDSGIAACPSGYFCLYEATEYNEPEGGERVLLTRVSVPDLRRYGFNDVASSVVNNTNWLCS
ncbi:peptidase inhibitor family I36 protein [Streptomyces sp. NPDC001966]